MSNKDDCISRRDAIGEINEHGTIWMSYTDDMSACEIAMEALSNAKDTMIRIIKGLPATQPELTDEQSIAHLQSSGWIQRHDKEMYERGLKEQLADDSDSYDSLLLTVQPEVIRCKNCEHWKNEHLCESLSRFGSFETKADFYCGYAERKN